MDDKKGRGRGAEVDKPSQALRKYGLLQRYRSNSVAECAPRHPWNVFKAKKHLAGDPGNSPIRAHHKLAREEFLRENRQDKI